MENKRDFVQGINISSISKTGVTCSVLQSSHPKHQYGDHNADRLLNEDVYKTFERESHERYDGINHLIDQKNQAPLPKRQMREGDIPIKFMHKDLYHPRLDFVFAEIATSPFCSLKYNSKSSNLNKSIHDVKYLPKKDQRSKLAGSIARADSAWTTAIDESNEIKGHKEERQQFSSVRGRCTTDAKVDRIGQLPSKLITSPSIPLGKNTVLKEMSWERENSENQHKQEQIHCRSVNKNLLKGLISDLKNLQSEKEELARVNQYLEQDRIERRLANGHILKPSSGNMNAGKRLPKGLVSKFRKAFGEAANFQVTYGNQTYKEKKRIEKFKIVNGIPVLRRPKTASMATGRKSGDSCVKEGDRRQDSDSDELSDLMSIFSRGASIRGLISTNELESMPTNTQPSLFRPISSIDIAANGIVNSKVFKASNCVNDIQQKETNQSQQLLATGPCHSSQHLETLFVVDAVPESNGSNERQTAVEEVSADSQTHVTEDELQRVIQHILITSRQRASDVGARIAPAQCIGAIDPQWLVEGVQEGKDRIGCPSTFTDSNRSRRPVVTMTSYVPLAEWS